MANELEQQDVQPAELMKPVPGTAIHADRQNIPPMLTASHPMGEPETASPAAAPVQANSAPENAGPPMLTASHPMGEPETASATAAPVQANPAPENAGPPMLTTAHPLPFDDSEPFAQTAAAVAMAEEEPLPEYRRSLWMRLLALFILFVIVAFSVFCIIWDIRKGSTAGGYRAGDIIKVEIVQQKKPEGADSELMDAQGRYTFQGIAETVMPSIAEIYTYKDGAAVGSGSGIILTADGFIATNAHVVSGAENYSVHLFDAEQDDKPYDAVLVGHDKKTDLAVLKISAKNLKPATLGDSDEAQLGETVCALGNPAGLSGSITTGIISGMNRKVRAESTNYKMDCFQTDAAISPGNSGGALVNLYGQVIGITSSKYRSNILLADGAYEGLGFAITINEALPILTELMEKGYVGGRVRIGIQFYDNDQACSAAAADGKTVPKELEGKGVLVMRVDEDSDLSKTSFKPGDWILEMNGKAVTDYDSINEAIEGCGAGDTVHCRCARILDDGSVKKFEIDFRLMEDQSGDY